VNTFTRVLSLAALAVALLVPQRAEAGRIGGPAWGILDLAPGQTVSYDVPFAANEQANIAVMGNGPGNVELAVFDSDGHVTRGSGMNERRVAVVNVYRPGYFRVVISNTGAVSSTVLVGTN
jgi:hypothetical protein